MEIIYHANTNQKKARVATLISGKIYCRTKNFTRDFFKSFLNDKGVNSSGEQNNPKRLCTLQQSFKTHEVKN